MGFVNRFRFAIFCLVSPALFAAKLPDWKVNVIDLGIQYEGRSFSFNLADWAINAPPGTRFAATGLPSWITLDPNTGTLSGSPLRKDVGDYDRVIFTLYSGSQSATTFGKGTVLKVLRPPTWTAPQITFGDARQGYPFTQTLMRSVSNPELAPLKFEVISTTPPSWLTLGTKTGALFGTPTKTSVGPVVLRVKFSTVLDGTTYEDFTQVRFNVVAVNRPPVWLADPLLLPTATSLVYFEQSLRASVSDPDSDTVTFSLASGPAWASLDSQTGLLSGTPSPSDAANAEWIVVATDTHGGSAQTHVRTKIASSNLPPQWQAKALSLPAAQDGVPYQIDLGQYASDPNGDNLTFALLNGPAWVQVSSAGGLLGVPTRKDVGPVKITVRADDGRGGNATADFSFFVDPYNRPPYWVLNPVTVLGYQGSAVRVDMSAYARDDDGQPLQYGLVQTAGWGKISTATGIFVGIPPDNFVGKAVFQFRVTDPQGAGSNVELQIQVKGVNRPPVWSAITLPDATEASPYQSSIAQFAKDPDSGDSLTFDKVGPAPEWLSVAANGTVSGTPGPRDTGAAKVLVRVTDSEGAYSETQFTLQVASINHPPRWRAAAPLLLGDIQEGSPFRFSLASYAVDDDGDALVFELVGGPNWVTVAANGVISGKPGRANVGSYQLVLRVRDSRSWADTTASGIVRKINLPPIVKADWPVFQVKEREVLKGTLNTPANIVDPEGQALTFYLKQNVPWIALAADGSFTLSPKRAERGPQAFAFSADDGYSSILGALRIEVLPNPRPPVWYLNPIQRLALANGVFTASVAAHVQDLDGSALAFTKRAGKDWLTVNGDGTLEGVPQDTDLGINRFTLTACNSDKQCADAVLVVDVQKGLAGDQVKLGTKTSGAIAELVWVLDPSTNSKPVVEAVNKSIPDLKTQLAGEKVAVTACSVTTAPDGAPDGVQSPLWVLYGTFTNLIRDTSSTRLAAQGLSEMLVVTRQRDALRWFADKWPSHHGIGAGAYWNSLSQVFATRGRNWRVSAVTPSCPTLGEALGDGANVLPENTYRDWATNTGGMIFDQHCKVAGKEWLTAWGSEVAFWAHMVAKKQIALSKLPTDPRYIEVSIAGTALKKGGPSYSYDAKSNSVKLDWSTIDKRGLKASDWVQVKYPAAE